MTSSIDRANWTVNWKMTESAGLMIYLANYKGRRVLWEASLPYVTIDHQNDNLSLEDEGAVAHGPFWVPLGERSQAGDVRVQDFRGGFEIAVDFSAGPFAYTQMWRFHSDGRLAPWLTIHGPGVHDAHTYHPHWRFDFDLNGSTGDALERFEEGSWNRVEKEGWFPYTGESDDKGAVWRQVDCKSGGTLSIRPHHWEDAELYAIKYRDRTWASSSPHSEDRSGQTYPAAYVGSEPLADEDVTLWYVAHVHYDLAFPFTAGPWLRVDGF